MDSELNQQLRKIHNHLVILSIRQETEKTKKYNQPTYNLPHKARNELIKKEWANAYQLRQSYTANGGRFSYAQYLANKSRCNIIGVKGEYIAALEGNKRQYFIFRPQNKPLGILSNLGNFLLAKWYKKGCDIRISQPLNCQ
nr:hypothetical protein [Providencia sp. PROV129]